MIALLKQMIDVYWNMLIFKRSPLATPDSQVMLFIAVCLSFFVSSGQLFLSYFLGKLSISLSISILLIILQMSLAFLYSYFIFWTQNQLKQWQKFMTCWAMMLFQLDSLAFIFMLLILFCNLFGLLMVLQKPIILISLIVGLILSLWQIGLSIRMYQIFLQKKIGFALMIYLGWFGLNFLFLITFKGLF